MSKVFFTADTHFGHDAIIQFCNRPWKNAARMDRVLIRNWNETVSEEDTVYVIGDFVWAGPSKIHKVESITQKLNGTKILIYGNHDRLSPTQYAECGFHQILYPYGQYLNNYLFHDPALAIACPDGSICITGHLHSLYGRITAGKKNQIILDVGVDGWDYHPVEYAQILKEIDSWKKEQEEKHPCL